jgi:phosphatidylglycerol:prolipoprotein diacylglycerol transferase
MRAGWRPSKKKTIQTSSDRGPGGHFATAGVPNASSIGKVHSSYLQLGRLHIPIFGVFAALGLMAALALSQRTARYANLSPEAVWNAGMTAILSAFVISRLLLVAFNLRSFLEYPLLVLALPSLTTLGVCITGFFMLGYIRWRKLPLLPLLDAAAPCAALLWTFLSLGRLLDGTRDGMPMHSASLPRGLPAPAWPVESFTSTAAFALFWLTFKTVKAASPRSVAGVTAALGLFFAGLAIYFLDFLRLPSQLLPNAWLDPAQIIGMAMILTAPALFWRALRQAIAEKRNKNTHAV